MAESIPVLWWFLHAKKTYFGGNPLSCLFFFMLSSLHHVSEAIPKGNRLKVGKKCIKES